MAYTIIEPFWDKHLKTRFEAGDFYPHDKAPDGWVDVLVSGKNAVGRPFLVQVEDEKSKRKVKDEAE